MVRRHHQLNGHEFEQTPGDGEGQGSLVYAFHGVAKSWAWLSDCTELKFFMFSYVYDLFLSGSHVLCSFVISVFVNYLF